MLTCKEFLGWLNDCLDNTADAETRALVEKHVSNCANCWVVYDTTKKTLSVYKGDLYRGEPQPVPESLKARLLDAIQRRCGKSPVGTLKREIAGARDPDAGDGNAAGAGTSPSN